LISLMLLTTLQVAKEYQVSPDQTKPINKIEMDFRSFKADKGEVNCIELKNTDLQNWKFDKFANQYINSNIQSTIVYKSKRGYNNPVKLNVYCEALEEGMEIEVYCDDLETAEVKSNKNTFRYKDYNQGNLTHKRLSLESQKKTLIEDIYNCEVRLGLNFTVRFDTRIPAGKTVIIKYEISE
ncbi:MAG TPA: hypothetical protein PLH63_08325, partial [Candidatus Cloacimonadota bacterium]|nr:hypothetical protein [Candidatus Cloacimonadota bacterium]